MATGPIETHLHRSFNWENAAPGAREGPRGRSGSCGNVLSAQCVRLRSEINLFICRSYGGYRAALHALPQVYGGVWADDHCPSCIAGGVNCSNYYAWLTNFVQNREGNCATFWAVVVANFATTTADGDLEQESNLHILQKCSSGHLISYANKKGHSMSGLAFTMVETRGIEPLTS